MEKPINAVTPEGNSNHDRRSFLKKVGLGAVLGASGALGGAGIEAVRSGLNDAKKNDGPILDSETAIITNNHKIFSESIKQGDEKALEAALQLLKAYQDEIIWVRGQISNWQNFVMGSPADSGARALAENSLSFYTKRQEWLMNEIRAIKEPIDAHLKPVSEKPQSQGSKVKIM